MGWRSRSDLPKRFTLFPAFLVVVVTMIFSQPLAAATAAHSWPVSYFESVRLADGRQFFGYYFPYTQHLLVPNARGHVAFNVAPEMIIEERPPSAAELARITRAEARENALHDNTVAQGSRDAAIRRDMAVAQQAREEARRQGRRNDGQAQLAPVVNRPNPTRDQPEQNDPPRRESIGDIFRRAAATGTLDQMVIVASDGQFLGNLSPITTDPKSIFNKFGEFGNSYSSTSIWNDYGNYGGSYGLSSANNDYCLSPPKLYFNGVAMCFLTTNTYKNPGLSPGQVVAMVQSLAR